VTPSSALISKIKSEKNSTKKNFYKLIYFSKIRQQDSILNYVSLLEKDKRFPENNLPELLYFKAYYYRITQNDSLSFLYHYKAFLNAEKQKDSSTTLAALSGLAQSYDYNTNKAYRLDYLNLLELKATEFNNVSYKIIHDFLKGNYYQLRDEDSKAIEFYNKTLQYDFKKRDSTTLLYALNSLGVLYQENLKNSDSALFYYKKKLDIINSNTSFQFPSNYFSTYINIANSYKSKNALEKAEYYYNLADSVDLKENNMFYKALLKQNLSELNANKNDYKLAYTHLLEYNTLSDSINLEEQRTSIARIKEEFDNQKLRADNLESEAKRKQNQNIAVGLAGSLALGSIIAFLLFKNTKRKQKLAEQEKELETQKLANVLKEQELNAIDAMIEGQEKERQRIANDLHDDLGGLMANVKLHFNALKDQKSQELFNRTNMLIDEAYEKVRTIAHAKNSGVIAKQGLLKAIQQMADKVSASNKITINVIDHGLDERLENSLELTIFRIIQELITNVIKHANADEVNIHITNHEDALNIMVEDNGKGFNASQITKTKKGMGISSIDKRIEHLNGTMTIESEEHQGTTIIIDIPI
ncbi:MAG: sensor histidine kinase, partial [Algicola sp.]|nr:sensor histidine kinase [Algicola sp.]